MSKEVYTVRYSYAEGDIGPAKDLSDQEQKAVMAFSEALWNLQDLGIRVELIYSAP